MDQADVESFSISPEVSLSRISGQEKDRRDSRDRKRKRREEGKKMG